MGGSEAESPRRRVYPGVFGEYTETAWWWAERMTDGRITDELLEQVSRNRELPWRDKSGEMHNV